MPLSYSTHKDFSSLPDFNRQLNFLDSSIICQLPNQELSIQSLLQLQTTNYLVVISSQ
jgi:hypothetical protein